MSAAAASVKRGRPALTIRARRYNLSSRSRIKASSRPFGPRPRPIGECSATGQKMPVLKTRISTGLRKTPRYRSLTSPTSKSSKPALLSASPLRTGKLTEIEAASAMNPSLGLILGSKPAHQSGRMFLGFLGAYRGRVISSSEERHYDPLAAVCWICSSPRPTGVTFQPCATVTQLFLSAPRFAIRKPLNVMNVPSRLVRKPPQPARAAEQVGNCGSTAAIRHVDHVDAGHHLEQLSSDVLRCPDVSCR
jgi:hypothetical protein